MSISLDRPRRFAHVDGFCDGAKYIEIMPNGEAFAEYVISHRQKVPHYNLNDCLSFVRTLVWKELP